MTTIPSAHDERIVFDPVLKPIAEPRSGVFYVVITLMGLGAVAGTLAWFYQLRYGLRTTGMNAPVFWGIYLVNFIFFTGISMAGTMISAVLRIANAEWRRPITRLAEAVTVIALSYGGLSIAFDEGRPDRLLNVIFYGRVQSPIFWDIVCVTAYLSMSALYLYLPLIPDLALLRDRKIGRTWLYEFLAFGYTGAEKQKKRLEAVISVMAVVIIPIAISVHSVVSYIFATTLQPGWHSTVFGPYFVVGALFSGLAALMIVMAILRRSFHLEGILKDIHFNNVALVLLAMDFLVIYFTLNINLIEITGQEPAVLAPVLDVVLGRFSLLFWGMVIGGFIIPAIILLFPKGRSVTGCVIASSLIVVGMWIERFLIVVPTLLHPRMPWGSTTYFPTWVEWAVTGGCICGFVFFYMLFTRFFPVISIWEVEEGIQRAAADVRERVEQYMPMAYQKIGEIMISQGLITKAQLDEALDVQKEGELLGDTLIRLGFIVRTQRDELAGLKLRIGEFMIGQGLITEAQLEEALDAKKEGELFGDTLIRLGFIAHPELEKVVGNRMNEVT